MSEVAIFFIKELTNPILRNASFFVYQSSLANIRQGWNNLWRTNQGILKGEVSLYCWPPVWLVWNQLY